MDTIELLKQYDRLGFTLVPLKGKVPISTNWTEDVTPKSKIKKHISEGGNVGVLCGERSRGVMAIDVDRPRDIGYNPDPAVKIGALLMETSKARRLVFYASKEVYEKFSKKVVDSNNRTILEVLGRGRQFVVPPSIHPKGNEKDPKYKWVSDLSKVNVKEVLTINGEEELKTLLGLICENPLGREFVYSKIFGLEEIDIDKILKGVPEGGRDESTIRLATWLRKKGVDKEEALKILEKWNERNKPPLSKVVIKTKVESAYKPKKPYAYWFRQDPSKYQLDGLKLREVKVKSKGKKRYLSFDEAMEKALNPQKVLNAPIHFDDEIGIVYLSPIKSYHKVPILAFPQVFMADLLPSAINKGFPQEEVIDGVNPQPHFKVESVPLLLSSSLSVEMLRLYHAARNEPNFLWKPRNDLFALLLTKQETYIFFDRKVMYDVLACWIVGTYLFPMFSCFPYLILVGAKKSGKSTVLDFLSLICWNATKKMACPSESSLFRLVQCAKPTQLIDEIHRLLIRPDISGALQSVLEVGFEKDGVVPRVDRENRVVELFEVYSPKALASREKLEVEDKGIVFIMQPATDVRYGKARQRLVFEKELPALRIELIKFALTHWEEIKKEYERLEPDDKLYGRDFLLFAPLLAVCKVIFPDRFKEMTEYAERASAEKVGEAWESENQILSCLLSRADEVGSFTYLAKVRDWLEWESWQSVYSAFRNLGIIKKSADSKKGKRYYLDWDKIKKQAEARGIKIEKEEERRRWKEEHDYKLDKAPPSHASNVTDATFTDGKVARESRVATVGDAYIEEETIDGEIPQAERLQILLGIIKDLEKQYGDAKREEIYILAQKRGIDGVKTPHDLEYLKFHGIIFEPREDVFKVV
jgi:hypothetical protein